MGWGVGSTASWSWCIPRFIPLWFHPPQYKMLMLPQQTLGTCSKFACQDSMLASKTTLTLSLNALPWMLNWLCCVLLLKKAGRSYLCSMEKKWEYFLTWSEIFQHFPSVHQKIWWICSTCLLSIDSMHGESPAKYNPTEPIPLQVKYVAVKCIVEPTDLAIVFELWRHLPNDAVLTPAISPVTGRLVEGGSILFLPVQVERTCPRAWHEEMHLSLCGSCFNTWSGWKYCTQCHVISF